MRRLLWLLLAGCATAPAGTERFTWTDAVFPGGSDAEGGNRTFVTRLVDDLSGEPLAGVDIYLVHESATPLAGEFWWTYRGCSDAEGFVRIAVAGHGTAAHLQVAKFADGGVVARTGEHADVWRVGRRFDVPVELRDRDGRPVAGARIGWCGGCGHTPDLTNATTDANGIAVLRGIDPQQDIGDLYVQHPGLALGYESLDWRPGDAPFLLQCGAAPVMTGQVLDHHGQPLADAFVGAVDVHRGPWTKTAADGTFTLLGGKAEIGASKVVTNDGREVYFATPSRYPVVLRLPDPAGDDPTEGTLDVPPIDRRVPVAVAQRCAFEVEVESGREWNVTTSFVGAERAPQRRAVLDGPGRVTLAVPTSGRVSVEVWPKDHRGIPIARRYEWPEPPREATPPIVAYFPKVQVLARVVGPMGEPVACRAALRSWGLYAEDEASCESADGRLELAAWISGKASLTIRPLDAALRGREVVVTMPRLEDPAPTVDLGTVIVGPEPQLSVVDATGRPARGVSAKLVRAGCQEVDSGRPAKLDDEGAWIGPEPMAGDVIELERDGYETFRTTLLGDGPWRLALPDGALTLVVTDEDGEELPATVSWSDRRVEDEATIELRGLPLGPTRFWVTAPGRRCAVVDTSIAPASATADGSPVRTIRLRLPRRRS